MQYLRYNTASQVIKLPKQLDSTDGNTPETGLTIANTDIRVWKHGATSAANKNSGGASHASNGDYYCTLDATDTNTLGRLVIETHLSGALYTRSVYTVLPQMVYDALVAGSDNLEIDVAQWLGSTAPALSTLAQSSVCTEARLAELGSANIPADVDTLLSRLTATRAGYLDAAISSRSTLTAQQVWEYATRTLSSFGSLVSDIAAAVWGATTRTLSAFGFSVTVGTNNDKSGYALSSAGVTAVQSGLSTLTAQQVWEYATRTLSAFGFNVTVGTNNDKTGYTLTATPPTASAIADAVWDEALSGHSGAGSAGEALAGASAPSAEEVADAVWDEAISGHLDSGSTGAALNAAGGSGDPWETSLPGAYGSGTAGNIIGNRIDAAITSRLAAAGYTAAPSASDNATAVWGATTRTLSSFGSLVSDIVSGVWNAVTRTITGMTGTIQTLDALDTAQDAQHSTTQGAIAALPAPPSAADIRSEIDSSSTVLAAIQAVTDVLDAMIEDAGAYNRFRATALEEAPSGTGGGGDATEAHQLDMIDKLKGLMSKAHALATAVGTFDPATDSTEAIRDRGDAAWTTGGGMSGSNPVTITLEDGDGANIVEAAIEIWDEAGTTFYERKYSNSSGQAVFSADAGTYTVKMHKAGYGFDDETLVVDGPESETYEGEAFSPGTPPSPDVCRLYTYLLKPSGAPADASIQKRLKIVNLPHESGDGFCGQAVDGVYDAATGLLYWDVVQGAVVEIWIREYGFENTRVTVPAAVTAKLGDLV